MRQVIAIGGGGFGRTQASNLIEQYILDQVSTKSSPNICFIPTATGDLDPYVVNFYSVFSLLKFTKFDTIILRPWFLAKKLHSLSIITSFLNLSAFAGFISVCLSPTIMQFSGLNLYFFKHFRKFNGRGLRQKQSL